MGMHEIMKMVWLQAATAFDLPRRFPRNREELAGYRNGRLRRLVDHAYRNVPYYRRLFDSRSLKPEHIRGVQDLPLIPVTCKTTLKSLPPADLLSRDEARENLRAFHTSGSSGTPFTFRRTDMEQRVLRALRVKAMKRMGLRFRDSIALIAGISLNEHQRDPLIWRMLQWPDPRRRIAIDALRPMEDIRRELLRFRPRVVIGYANTLARLAGTLTREDRKRIRPRFVQTDSEVLTPLMRAQIVRGFGAPVFEMYDTHEFNMLAWECGTTGDLHVCDDGVILEVLKDGRPCAEGERGEVVATGLHSFAMPFIRYRLGDIVTRGADACRCGLPFSTIRSVQGRMIDYFPLPGGRLMHPYEIVEVLNDRKVGWLRQYQLLQEKRDRIVLRAVPLSPPLPEDLDRLETALGAVVGPDVKIGIRLVPEIDTEITGKFRVSRSLVDSPYDGMDWGREGGQ